MNIFTQAYSYALAHSNELLGAVAQHMRLVGVALGIGIVVCVPAGVWTSRSRVAALTVINLFNAVRVVPSLAILFLAIPYFGLTFTSAAIALTVLALPPILINSDTAFRNIDPSIREAAFGMGMSKWQVLWRVDAPLALPVILTGIRTATIEVIASATLAALIGAGGLGIFVTRGFALYDNSILLVGAIPVALLALLAEFIMSGLQRIIQPPA
jgi:osmoprotectant transport system permease protein